MTKSKTKKLGNSATQRELKEAHCVKMEMKRMMRDHNSKKYANRDHVFANISQNHEHYGDTPREHEARKNNS